MKYFIVVALFFIIFAEGTTTKKNTFLNRDDVYDEQGKDLGYVKKNSFLNDTYDIYDSSGQKKGLAEWNHLLNRWEFRKDDE